MKKDIITWFILLLVLVSCGARKVNIDNTKITKDSTSISMKQVIDSSKKDVVDSTVVKLDIESNEVEICPIDSSKAIIVNGVSYKNAFIRHKKIKDNSLYYNTNKVSETKHIDSVATKIDQNKVAEIIHKKDVDKEADYSLYILLLIIAIVGYLTFKYAPSVR